MAGRSGTTAAARCFGVALAFLGLSVVSPASARAADATLGPENPGERTWADFVEPDFPFVSSVVDARSLGFGVATNNLTARALVLNLGHEAWAAFDLDLLRLAVLWTGPALTPASMAQGSYHVAGRKAPEGEDALPQIAGTPWLVNGLYPGWQAATHARFADPRAPGPEPSDLGRGPLPEDHGRFLAIQLLSRGARLEYTVADSRIAETLTAVPTPAGLAIARRFRLSRVTQPLVLVLGLRAPGSTASGGRAWHLRSDGPTDRLALRRDDAGPDVVRVGAGPDPLDFEVILGPVGAGPTDVPPTPDAGPAAPVRRWPGEVITRGSLAPATRAVVLDRIPLPVPNPWRRNVRLADLAFLPGGEARLVTFDGDVWRVAGLEGDLTAVRWGRFASGLHEPLGIAVRHGEVFVHDRNGLWRLRDADHNGEADRHELVFNGFVGTAETREFASGLRVAPDGSFVLAKGGQRGRTLNPHAGSVLRIAADGRTMRVLGHGFRQPFLGVHPDTGTVTVSDQQGHYTPTTPLHLLEGDAFHGFLPLFLPRERYPAPIADPLTWIPHPINASGAGQVWWTDARAGALEGALIHLGYYRPEVFLVRLNPRGQRTQAAVVSLTRDLDFPPLAGAVNPADGQLYLTGFQIWGTVAPQISGLARLRATPQPGTLPRTLVPTRDGILLGFDVPLDPRQAADPANYAAERWNYRRSAEYGSPHFRLDGTKGQETLTPNSATLSRDGRAVFISLPDLRPVMQMRLGWSLRTADGATFSDNAYFTPHELVAFDPPAEGFDTVAIDPAPRPAPRPEPTPITATEGQRLAELMGCVACHSTDGSTLGKSGPTWKGLFGREREFADGTQVRADDAYLREAIREPTRRVVRGFENSDTGMPSYEGVLTPEQIEALVRYLRNL